MNNYWYILILIGVLLISLIIKKDSYSSRNFSNLIRKELKKKGMRFVSSTSPGLFKTGPFDTVKISIGKPQINNGAIKYEKTYYRIVVLKTINNETKTIWAKIDTSMVKATKIEFKGI